MNVAPARRDDFIALMQENYGVDVGARVRLVV